MIPYVRHREAYSRVCTDSSILERYEIAMHIYDTSDTRIFHWMGSFWSKGAGRGEGVFVPFCVPSPVRQLATRSPESETEKCFCMRYSADGQLIAAFFFSGDNRQ